MLAANDNRSCPKLQVAVWKMVRTGMAVPVILSTLNLTTIELARIRTGG